MSKKKKIKINVKSDETAEKENTEKSAPAIDEFDAPKDETGDDGDIDAKNPLKELEAKLESKEEEAKETYDRLLRISADFENYKKRSTREMEEFRKYANQSLLKEMLSVIDNLELAINSSKDKQDADKNLIEGLTLTLN